MFVIYIYLGWIDYILHRAWDHFLLLVDGQSRASVQ